MVLRVVTWCWSALPLRLRAALTRHPGTARLDYPPRAIRLLVTSSRDIDRASSCAKEPGTVRWIEQRVRGVFYDIGANVGAYSLLAWASSDGRTRVIAFEPGFSTFTQLCRNIVLNGCGDGVTPLNIALSDRSGLTRFRYSSIEAGAASHLGLSASGAASGQNDTAVAFEQPVWAWTLDEAVDHFELPPPDHIKIDVDGHELAVLRGAARTLRSPGLRSVQIELGDRDPDTPVIRELLATCGFRVESTAPHPTGQIADCVFLRPPAENLT